MSCGYKAFYVYPDDPTKLRCRDFVFEVGQTYEESEAILCEKGFHYCTKLENVFKFYNTFTDFVTSQAIVVVVCSVIDLGIKKEDDFKCCTTKILIDSFLEGDIDGYSFKNGRLHSDDDDLPAVKLTDGTKQWFKDGKQHREGNKPAIEFFDGSKQWWKDGKKHRDGDSPALEYCDGHKQWWRNGKLHRDGDLPAIEYSDGSQTFWKHGERHRDGDLPAVVWASGSREWWKNDKRHRDNELHAVELADGTKQWWKDGKYLHD